jgi:hypothetical protein
MTGDFSSGALARAETLPNAPTSSISSSDSKCGFSANDLDFDCHSEREAKNLAFQIHETLHFVQADTQNAFFTV